MVIAESNNNIIDGLGYSKIIKQYITKLNNQLKEKYNICPQIAIILVGNNIASEIYVRNKIKLANEIGIIANVIRFNIDITEEEILKQIENINNNNDIDGVIVQLPLPMHINKDKVLLSISPRKDIDGLKNEFQSELEMTETNHEFSKKKLEYEHQHFIREMEIFMIKLFRISLILKINQLLFSL